MIYIGEIAASFIETFLGIWFPAKALANRKLDPVKNGFVTVLLTCVVWILNQYALVSVFTSIVGILLLSLGTRLVYRMKYFDVLPMMGYYMILIYVCDFLSLSFLGVALNRPDFASYATSGLSYQRILFLAVSKSMLVLVSCLIAKMYFKYSLERYAVVLFYLGESVILCYMVMRTLADAGIDTFLLWILLVLLNISGMYSAIQHSMAAREREGSFIEKEKNRLLAEDYKSLIRSDKQRRVFYHDLKNQYLVIKSYLEQREYKKAEEYMEKIHSFSPETELCAYTGIEILDFVLSNKISLARNQGVIVSIMAEKIRLPLTEPETAAFMSNLLDNAIEACREVEERKKWIQIIIRQIGDISVLKVSNSYSKEPHTENDVFISGKEDRTVHGIGLESVKAIVEKYDGEMDIRYGNKQFTVTISFFN